MECATCGLAPCDLPDGTDPELIFTTDGDGEMRCQIHSLDTLPGGGE